MVAPVNDDFANAITLHGYSGTILATTVESSFEPGEISSDPFWQGTVWYKYTVPAGATLVTFTEFLTDSPTLSRHVLNWFVDFSTVQSNDTLTPAPHVVAIATTPPPGPAGFNNLTSGRSYYLRVMGVFPGFDFTLSWQIELRLPPLHVPHKDWASDFDA